MGLATGWVCSAADAERFFAERMPPKGAKKEKVEIIPEFHPFNIPVLDRGRCKFNRWHKTKKYYRGSRGDTIWNQDLFRRGLLESEQRYLQEIDAGTHKSLALYPGRLKSQNHFPPPSQRTTTPIGHWGDEQWTERARTPPAHISALQHLKTFNTTLSAGLGNLRESLQSTNKGLDSCLQTWHHRPRPRSTTR